jgi:hypothetical protein
LQLASILKLCKAMVGPILIKILAEFDTTRCNLVDGLPELRANGKNTASGFVVSALPRMKNTIMRTVSVGEVADF